MALSNNPSATRPLGAGPPDVETELRSALEDLANGDFVELTPEEIERCSVTGESPWRRESRG